MDVGDAVEVAPVESGVSGFAAWACTGGADPPLTYRVLEGGTGPPVVVMHELTGAGPTLLALAWTLRNAGYRTWLPIFFEPGGQNVSPLSAVRQICIRKEFRSLLCSGITPLSAWLGELLTHAASESEHPEETGRGAAVIGMCMTGGLVFAQMAHPKVDAAVAAQPSMPMAPDLPLLGARGAASLGLTREQRSAAVSSSTPLLALRFEDDRICASARMEAVRTTFGTGPCEIVEADDVLRVEQCGRLRVVEASGSRHSTLTRDAIETQGRTVDHLLAFLSVHLPPT